MASDYIISTKSYSAAYLEGCISTNSQKENIALKTIVVLLYINSYSS